MKKLFVLSVVGAAGALASAVLGACASEGDESPAGGIDAASTADVVTDAAGEAEPEAGPCVDCEFFPAACSPDAFCANGPFDLANPSAGMDWKAWIYVIRGRSASDVWIAGTLGAVAHFDGASWTPSDLGARTVQRALWLRDTGEVSLGSVDAIYTRGIDIDAGSVDAGVSAGGWVLRGAATRVGTVLEEPPRAAWSAPGSEWLWLAVRPQSPNQWSALLRLRLTSDGSFEISPALQEFFMPGLPYRTCEVLPCSQLSAVHGSSADTVWAVGDQGAAIRVTAANGPAPVPETFNTKTSGALYGVWAASDSEAWAVGATGTVRHYKGEGVYWEAEDVPTKEHLNAVWGTSSSDVWAVGNAGVVVHYDGTSWSRVKIAGLGARRPDLYTVWSPGPSHVWVGGQGVVLSLGAKL